MQNKRLQHQSFESGALILLVSAVVVKIIGAFFKIPLSNLLGDTGFGQFSSAYDLFTPFYVMAMSGMPVALSRLISNAAQNERYGEVTLLKKLGRGILLKGGIFSLVCFIVLIPILSKAIGDFGNTVYGLFAVAPSILMFFIMSYYRGIYEGLESMTPTAISDLIEAAGKLILGYGFAYITLKLTQNTAFAAAAALLGITVGVAAAMLYLKLKYKKHGDVITRQQLGFTPEPTDTAALKKNLISVLLPITL